MVVLGWIRSNPGRWKTFVCNRVTEIQAYTTPTQGKHCPGEDNPADYLSRGVNADQLKGLDTWWRGPPWLSKSVEFWPRDAGTTERSPPEERKTPHPVLHIITPAPLLDPSRYSSYWKLLRVTDWTFTEYPACSQIIGRTDSVVAHSSTLALDQGGPDSFSVELDALQRNLHLPKESKIARFNPFLQNRLICLGGRLQCADLSEASRHPLLLDGKHHFVHLLICQIHIRVHHMGIRINLSELREEFRILRARQAIKKVLHKYLP